MQDPAEIVENTDEFNRSSEVYFAQYEDKEFIRNKPYSENQLFSKRLFDMGILFHGIRLARGEVVLEFGSGTCWLSHFLNLHGCKTISVDVSPTALQLGRELFERDSRTNWKLEPEFVVYDGYRIPLPDACCDKVVINDAFHHVPNQRQILSELARVLRPQGILGMCEPGQDHGSTYDSQREMEETGVLENDIVVEDLARLAKECGFRDATLIPASPNALREIPAVDLGAFMRGKGFPEYWERLCGCLQDGSYLFLHKHSASPTTRQPRDLGAKIYIPRSHRRMTVSAGEAVRLPVRIKNNGDTLWLAENSPGGGWTRVGAHLYREGELVDFDWHRCDLPVDLDRGKKVKLDLTLPSIEMPGNYRIELDMVVEGLTWFAERGSDAGVIAVEVLG